MKPIKHKTETLIEALPYIQKYHGKIVVIKYGGKAMIDNSLKASVMKDIVLLKHVGIHPVVVHGGGPDISKAMTKASLKPKFVHGLRVTDLRTLKIVKNEFIKINSQITDYLKGHGAKAIGLSGEKFIKVDQKDKKLGLVGEIKKINTNMIKSIIKNNQIPVIYPLGKKFGKSYNINADTAASSIAIALNAEKLTILTDVDGVFEKKKLVPTLTINEADKKINKKIIHGGMIPKVKACKYAVSNGCRKAHLINGTTKHALLLEIFTDKGIGTEVVR